jgi:membrane protein
MIRKYSQLFRAAYEEWDKDDAAHLGAALSFYTVLSLAPLLVVLVGVLGVVFGAEAAQGQLRLQVEEWAGPEVAKTVIMALENARKPVSGTIATAAALLTLFLGASGVLAELKNSLNKIFNVPAVRVSMLATVKQRFISFAMVLAIGFVLLASLVVSAGIAAMGKFLGGYLPWPEGVLTVINLAISFGVTTVLFAVLFKALPDRYISWQDIWIGAAVTSLLFSIGRLGLGLYLGKASVGSAYGAAGSVVVLLVWIYYAAQIFFFGAEFIEVHAVRRKAVKSR